MVAVSELVFPHSKVSAVGEREMPVTDVVTVTLQEAVYPPSAVVQVIVAVPPVLAVTVPFDTVATAVLLLFQVTDLFVALEEKQLL